MCFMVVLVMMVMLVKIITTTIAALINYHVNMIIS